MAKADGKKTKKADGKTKGDKKRPKDGHAGPGYEALNKLAEHPLLTDLLAVGAMAAVAAIAERGVASKTGQEAANGSRRAVKAAGRAAAAAIGQRLLQEVGGFATAASSKKA